MLKTYALLYVTPHSRSVQPAAPCYEFRHLFTITRTSPNRQSSHWLAAIRRSALRLAGLSARAPFVAL